MNYNKPKTKGEVSKDTLTRESQKNNIYKQMYNLPDFEGSDKQISYAVSLRIQLIENYETDKNTPEEVKSDLFERVLKINSAKIFLDEFAKYGKKFLWYHYKSDFLQQTTLTPRKTPDNPPVNLEKNETWLISTYNKNKITLRTADSSLNDLLKENGMTQISEFFWELPANINAVDRKSKENQMKDLLLDNGKQIKLEKDDPRPVPVYHDATIYKNNTKILVDCHTIGTLRAFLGINGKITVDITECNSDEIKKLLSTNYDIGFNNKETEMMFK